jgi:uncharacterized radical SAM protein YgiQ
VPAYDVVKHSVQIMRGCFGGCTFCSITTHQGRIIQSRSKGSILREIERMNEDPDFKGIVSDIGGPTANMYEMKCTKPEVEKICRRLSCVHPKVCKLLGTDHAPLIDVMREARALDGVRKVHVASGVRIDLASKAPEYLEELAAHHVSGRLTVAPEHVDPGVLDAMKKPELDTHWDEFVDGFNAASKKAGKTQQLMPYFISSHPGSDLDAMITLAQFLKQSGYRPDQVQDFIPGPMDVATAMYYTGINPLNGKEVPVARGMRDRRLQRALMQFFKPENYFLVREALKKAGRKHLIGNGPDCLIPKDPPKAAIDARRKRAQVESGDIHRIERAAGDKGSADGAPGQGRRRDDRRDRGKGKTGYRPEGKP